MLGQIRDCGPVPITWPCCLLPQRHLHPRDFRFHRKSEVRAKFHMSHQIQGASCKENICWCLEPCGQSSLCPADSMEEGLSRETGQNSGFGWGRCGAKEKLKASEKAKEPRVLNRRVSTKTFESSHAYLSTKLILLALVTF